MRRGRLEYVKISGVWGSGERYAREAREYSALFDYLVRTCRRYETDRSGLFGAVARFYDCDVDVDKAPPEARGLVQQLLLHGKASGYYFEATTYELISI